MVNAKIIFCFIFTLYINSALHSQKTIKSTIKHGGIVRTFSFYIPGSYNSKIKTPLVFNLHGYTSNGDQQEFYGDFRKIADTANFIIVHPDGTLNSITNQRYWDVGLVGSGGIDDVGFIHALIDTLSSAYNIDGDRIYSTGMSNGGFMSYHLACNSTRFAAIASVTGSMTSLTQNSCKNASPIPIMEIHGDADPVVNYNGSVGVLSIPDVLNYWLGKNGLDPNSKIIQQVPDINKNDNANAELIYYPGNNPVAHYKILNGGHTWPGAPIVIGTTCMDFRASEVIWKFFSRYSKSKTYAHNNSIDKISIQPNPASTFFKITSSELNHFIEEINIYSTEGKLIYHKEYIANDHYIDLSNWIDGMYYVFLKTNGKSFTKKFIINKN